MKLELAGKKERERGEKRRAQRVKIKSKYYAQFLKAIKE